MNKQEENGPHQEQEPTMEANVPGKLKQLGMQLVSPGLDEDRLSKKMISKIKMSRDIEKNQKLLISKLSQKDENHANKPPAITVSSPEKTMPFKPRNHSLKRKKIPPTLNFSTIQPSSQLHASKSAPPNITKFPQQQINARVRYMGRVSSMTQEYPSPTANPYMAATYPYPYAGLPPVPCYPHVSTPTHTQSCEGYYPSLYPTPMYNTAVTPVDHQRKQNKRTRRSSHLDDLALRKKNYVFKQRSGGTATSRTDRETGSPVKKQVLSEDTSLNDDVVDDNEKEMTIVGEISLTDDVFKFEIRNDKDDYMKVCERIWNDWQNLKK
ncbi:dig2p [Saccharomyces arboricola H-6]|uniref:Dig2p n=1 Tax=Saccharomyces arboricola (strain H-6 / AS 2.3317 / CBS 10644) TaxID=1160507 RepID=J8Q0I8_SACAR|nr:dig2p [Saccharomyces arboricola H-6]